MQLTHADDVGPLEHPDDPPDRAPRTLAFDAQNLLGDLGGDRAALAAVPAITGKQGLKSAAAVRVVPGLDRTSRESNPAAVRPLVRAGRSLVDMTPTVAVLQARTGERTEHPQPPQSDRLLVVVLHGSCCNREPWPLLGGSLRPRPIVPDDAAEVFDYTRRTFGCSRYTSAATVASR